MTFETAINALSGEKHHLLLGMLPHQLSTTEEEQAVGVQKTAVSIFQGELRHISVHTYIVTICTVEGLSPNPISTADCRPGPNSDKHLILICKMARESNP